jgi:adenosylcobinamide-phosphate synthase
MSPFLEHLSAVASDLSGFLEPRFCLYALAGLLIDALIGDPVFAWHPVRLLGRLLAFFENRLFALGLNGYGGGILLLLLLAGTVLPLCVLLLTAAHAVHPWAYHAMVALIVWACVALRDLIAHGERIARAIAARDIGRARHAISMLVGRDTDRMDFDACGRGAVESLSENLVDGVLSPLFFLMLFGPLGGVLFKIISTMDSMVGYKNERYLRFGWCGARTDDVANYLPARWCFLLLCGLSALLPGCSARKAWRCGLKFHAYVPGPNSGWPEATIAGALQLRLIGPIYKNGVKVANIWLGLPSDPEGARPRDIRRSYVLLILSTTLTLALGTAAALWLG